MLTKGWSRTQNHAGQVLWYPPKVRGRVVLLSPGVVQAGEKMRLIRRFTLIASVGVLLLTCGCSRQQPSSTPSSAYPVAMDFDKVGKYSPLTKSGGGYVYDEVLEYRVWVHPGGDDYFLAFPTYEEAKQFSERTERSEEPLVLVLQREHINEPEPGKFVHVKGDRITEWRVEWLKRGKRGPDTIPNFLREKATTAQQDVPPDRRERAPAAR